MSRLALLGGGKATPGGGTPPFVGPLDGYSNIGGAYSVRRLLSAYTSNLIRLRRDSDNAESNFGYDGDGDLDTAAIVTWLGGANGYVTTWYDQSGNARDVVQATADNQPLYVASGPNSKPTVRFDGTNDRLVVNFSDIGSAQHVFSCLKQVSWVDGCYPFSGGTLQISLLQNNSSANVAMYAGVSGPRVDFTTTNYSVGSFYFSTVAGAHFIRRNGTQSSNGSAVGIGSCTRVVLGARWDQTLFGNVDISEWFMFSALQTNGPIESDMGSYYGITVV